MLQTLDMIANKKKKLILEERKSTAQVSDSEYLLTIVMCLIVFGGIDMKFCTSAQISPSLGFPHTANTPTLTHHPSYLTPLISPHPSPHPSSQCSKT